MSPRMVLAGSKSTIARILIFCLTVSITCYALTSCSSRGSDTYAPREIGQVMKVRSATVVSSRDVVINGLENGREVGWGTFIGASTAGAAAYGITGSDNPAGVAITIIAVVAGALAGTIADEQANSRAGVEYILSDNEGQHFAIVQTAEDGDHLAAGSEVIILEGQSGYNRVVDAK